MRNAVRLVADRLRTAQSVAILTGAGASAASGVPTFRGTDGLWRQHRATDLATPGAFARDPHLVWAWYAWRRQVIAGCRPNKAHDVLAAWTARHGNWRVLTQNVDDLHLRAGTRDLIRLHGSIWELSCWSGCRPATWCDERVALPEPLPRCVSCGGLARPAVVWFGEPLNADVMRAADAAAAACDVFVAVGTSAIVYPAAGLMRRALAHGAFTVEVNVESTPSSADVDLTIRAPAEDVLPAIDALL
jgi:NAD-dependent deacetylase